MDPRPPDVDAVVSRDGRDVRWKGYGDGDHTVVIVASHPDDDAGLWRFQVPHLARRHHVVVVEPHGLATSDSPRTTAADDVAEQAADMLVAMDAADTDRATIFGLSMGGTLALRFAAVHPERTAGVIAVAPTLPSDERALAAEEGPSQGWAAFDHTIAQITCPVLIVHGDQDEVAPLRGSVDAAALLADARLEVVSGQGHFLARPALLNRLFDEFLAERIGLPAPPPTPVPGRRPSGPRVLYLSSPIGLGHARRDVAIADELRRQVPEVAIEWLAQDPVTRVLEAREELVHPASKHLVSEAAHLEALSHDHELHVLGAILSMAEGMVANFSVFHEVVREGNYDLVVGDEAWEVDQFLHEEPDLKAARFAWLTDFVGVLPVDDKDAEDVELAYLANAEMVRQAREHPDVRDVSLFVGDLEDVVAHSLGQGLPDAHDWAREHYDFGGYVTGFDPRTLGTRNELRAEFGYGEDETICIAAVGGTGVGVSLLQRIVDAHPIAAKQLPGLRTVLVTGPRIDPDTLPEVEGIDKRSWVPDLHRHLAAADLAIVQGGLTTTMELATLGTPFLYVPLLKHFEQQVLVPHRLDRLGVGRRLDYATTTHESMAAAMTATAHSAAKPADVPANAAAGMAARLATLL